jgi:hypothetical protein
MPRTFPVSRFIGTLALATTANLGAEESAMEKLRARLKSADQFGTECCQLLSIPAAAFNPRDNTVEFHVDDTDFPGYTILTFLSTKPMWAPVSLPTGAVLDNIDLYYVDDDATSDICATLHAYTGPTLGGNPPADVTVGFVCSSGSGGVGYKVESLSGTIDNSVWFSNGAQYVVVISSPGGTHAFKGVSIWWHREVSSPPGTSTFNDVPTSHPQFQFIEALAESGITAGCGSGNYCPNNPLTRGQMAVFLAKALGLYTPF